MTSFEQQVGKWADKVVIDIRTFTKLVAFKMHDRIVERTPVDTGRARASWNIIAGEQADPAQAPEGFSGGGAAGQAAARGKQLGVGLSDVYTISNNLPYIEALENGHSKQAPAGMVALGIADIRTQLEVELG